MDGSTLQESQCKVGLLHAISNCWLMRVTLVVAFGLLPQNFGRFAHIADMGTSGYERARTIFVKISQHSIMRVNVPVDWCKIMNEINQNALNC